MKKQCNCKNVEIGGYGNQCSLQAPTHMLPLLNCLGEEKESNLICVDKCLEKEIKYLWEQEISTTGCCCGHNKLDGFIGVEFADIPKMKTLGYDVAHNASRPNDEDSFVPKSIKNLNKEERK